MNDTLLKNLNEKQRYVCEKEENFLLTACPGSGKTRTITHRLAYLQEKYAPSTKLNVAITYTSRAANEVISRLENMGVEPTTIWAGTIHQFCMHFIIRPYAMYSDRLRKGYRIINEYITLQYVEEIRIFLGIKKCHGLKEYLAYDQIRALYNKKIEENKEIDFDMILKLSLELLKNNSFIAENISNIVRSIHIDEYQDTNPIQYEILSILIKENQDINILFVGDPNQAIYSNLGGLAKSENEISEQFNLDFISYRLDGCYRSPQKLIDYYSNFAVCKEDIITLCDSNSNQTDCIIKYNTNTNYNDLANKIAYILKERLLSGIKEEQICIVAPQWHHLTEITKSLRILLPDIKFDSPSVSPFKH